MAPAPDLLTGATAAAATADKRCLLAFSTEGRSVVVNLASLPDAVTARWFDPTSGTLQPVASSPFPNTANQEFAPAGRNAAGDADWVLLLEAP
jgi:hypothetical protein